MSTAPDLQPLLDAVIEHAHARCRHAEDRAAARRRELLLAAEDHVHALEEAAREIGRTRGASADLAASREARAEVEKVASEAFDRLLERFERRVKLALEALPSSPRYGDAIGGWARAAARQIDGPVEVHTAPRDREAVYEALLQAGVEDFRVRAERRIGCGFVVRDMDGRTVADLRPEALVASRRPDLRRLLEAVVPRPTGLVPVDPEPATPASGGRA